MVLAQKELNLSKNLNITLDLKPSSINPSGGIMSVNLYRVADSYYYFNDTFTNNTNSSNYETVAGWLEPRGEILVIQKPSNTLDV